MSLPQITLDVPTLQLALCIVGGLLVISMVRILFLLRTNSRLRDSTTKMEQQVLIQHQEILSVRQDANAWRGELQRMFDAFRAELSKRLSAADQRYQDCQQRSETEIAKSVVVEAAAASPSSKAEAVAQPDTKPEAVTALPPMPALTIS